jgi:signal transduction histidine kinase
MPIAGGSSGSGEALQALARLQAVTSALSRSVTEAEVAAVVVRQAVDATGSDTGGILYQLSEDGRVLELLAHHATPAEPMQQVTRLLLDDDMPAAYVARTREAVWIENAEDYEKHFPRLARLFRPHTRAEAMSVVPLLVGDRLLGVIGMGFRSPRAFAPAERAFIETLAEQCAQALDRARAYERERRAHADAESARRSREELLAVVAHDLKNPLGMVILAAGTLVRRAPATEYGESVQRGANNILQAADRMERLVRDLLDAASIEAGHLSLSRTRDVDVGALVDDVLRLQVPYAEQKGITLTRDFGGGARAEVDRDRIAQVITNLAANALKFTPSGGEVKVRIEQSAEALVVRVEDSGPGIAPDDLVHLFARYGSGNQPGAETGLGLFIAKGIVVAHGGRIEVTTELAKGSVFSVTLPLESAG